MPRPHPRPQRLANVKAQLLAALLALGYPDDILETPLGRLTDVARYDVVDQLFLHAQDAGVWSSVPLASRYRLGQVYARHPATRILDHYPAGDVPRFPINERQRREMHALVGRWFLFCHRGRGGPFLLPPGEADPASAAPLCPGSRSPLGSNARPSQALGSSSASTPSSTPRTEPDLAGTPGHPLAECAVCLAGPASHIPFACRHLLLCRGMLPASTADARLCADPRAEQEAVPPLPVFRCCTVRRPLAG